MTLADHAIATQAALQGMQRDPLKWWKFGLEGIHTKEHPEGVALARLREAFGLFAGPDPISELHLRAVNKGGKTLSKAMFVMACAQKRKTLDGVKIPQWRGKVECLQLVLDYPQQLLSVKPAYVKALGNWPGRIVPNGEYIGAIHVMPEGGDPDNEKDWSVIHFLSQKNPDTARGARADVIDFDEPPKMEFLSELRKAGHSGRRSIRIIGETPLKRREWLALRHDYGDTPRRTLRRVDRYRAECRWSLDEIADWVLSPEEKAELRSNWSRDAQPDAREHGDYENVDAKCPFDDVTIMQMMEAWCVEPQEKMIRVAMEGADGEAREYERIPVQVWQMPKRGQDCYQCIDPASGVDDDAHNPAGLHLSDDDTGDLLVRWNGYLAPYSVGAMGAAIHRHYNHAATDIEMKDHWGVNVMRGYEANDGANLCHERRELTPGVWAKEVGFDVTQETRAIWIGCIQEWIAAFRAGAPYAICRSREVFECLLDTELDDRGRIVAGPGIAHGEDMVLLGQKLRRIQRPTKEAPHVYEAPPTPEAMTLEANKELERLIAGTDEPEPEWLKPENERPKW